MRRFITTGVKRRATMTSSVSFTGLHPSEQIALRVTDCDVIQGKVKVDKARVATRDKDRTKTSEDRIVELCSRALHVLKRQVALRAQLKLEGKINHEDLLFVVQ